MAMFNQNNSLNARVRNLEAEIRELRADKAQLEERLRYMRVILFFDYI
jgi:cell division protein FtsB